MLSKTYGETTISERTCHEWFQHFKNSDFDIEDWHGSGREKVYKDAELEALLHEDSSNAKRIGRIIGNDTTSHFKTPENHENNSETRKLNVVRLEEKC